MNSTLTIILLLSPLLIGGIIAALNAESVNNATEKAEAWIRKKQTLVSQKTGWFYRYMVNPFLSILVKFSDWTDNFAHQGLKNGVRVASTLYVTAVTCLLIWFIIWLTVMLVLFVAIVAIAGVALYIISNVFGNSDGNVKPDYESRSRIIGSVGPGKRINPQTGVVQNEGMLGWSDTDERIDPETGKVQKQGLLGWNDTETKINQETGIIQKQGFLGYNDTETRINPETGVIQKQGLLGWQDTEERINPETGRRQKSGLLGWVDE